MDKIRAEENEAYTQAKADLKLGLEGVCNEGHPDKLGDQVPDAVLNACP